MINLKIIFVLVNRPGMKLIRTLLFVFILLPAFQLSAQSSSITTSIEDGNVPAISGGCTADFTWVDSLGYVFFIGSSTLGNAGYYTWDFGDGNFSSQQYPSNTYSTPGTYTVCLAVFDSLQNFCDSTCHTIIVTNVSGLNENKNDLRISLSPNPSDENVTLAFVLEQSGNATISVYDIAGREIQKPVNEQFSQGKQQRIINTENFAPGAYFVQISVNGQSVISRLIVTHKQ